MTYYKVIQDNVVIDAGFTFFEWNLNNRCMFRCDVDHGQFVGSLDGNTFYRDDWMKIPPEEATGYKIAKIVVIDKDEYIALYDQLSKENVVLDDQIEIVTFSDSEQSNIDAINSEPEETVFTMSEMRKMLLEQQEKINRLTELLESKNE